MATPGLCPPGDAEVCLCELSGGPSQTVRQLPQGSNVIGSRPFCLSFSALHWGFLALPPK